MQQNNFSGIILMILSMAMFAIADTLIKVAADSLSSAHTAFFLIGGGVLCFWLIAIVRRIPLRDRRAFSPIMWARYLAEITATLSIVTSLALVPLSTLGAILQATPLIVAGGAVLFLKEQVTWRRWAAIGVGFIGMLMILRPGSQTFEPATLWAVLAMLALSARDLTTRLVPDGMPTIALATYTLGATLPFTIAWCLVAEGRLYPETIERWDLVIGMIAFATIGYLMITLSVRLAEVSVVSPFRYSRLIFLLLLGIWVFSERPDAMMLAGAGLIIASGIYTMWRDHLRSQNLLPG